MEKLNKIELTAQDLRLIKDIAGQNYLSSNCPKNLDSSEFLVYCYTKAVEIMLAKKGVEFTVFLPYTEPYESIE